MSALNFPQSHGFIMPKTLVLKYEVNLKNIYISEIDQNTLILCTVICNTLCIFYLTINT